MNRPVDLIRYIREKEELAYGLAPLKKISFAHCDDIPDIDFDDPYPYVRIAMAYKMTEGEERRAIDKMMEEDETVK